jgi:hypothetical protein
MIRSNDLKFGESLSKVGQLGSVWVVRFIVGFWQETSSCIGAKTELHFIAGNGSISGHRQLTV